MDEPHCILVVEDHPDILRIMQVVLTQQGHEVCTATSAYEALGILATLDPHLLILDLMMPLVSGWDVLAIRLTDPKFRRIPTIVVSATAAFDQDDARKYDVLAVLQKPFDPITQLVPLAASGLRAFAAQNDDPA